MNELVINIILFASAFLSGLAVIIFKIKFSKNLKLLISFSGAFLLAICVLHLIPEIFTNYDEKIGMYILLGFLIQLLLEFFSDGIEHGHFHTHSKNLAVFPYAIFISLCLHSFIEGMALIDVNHFHHHDTNSSLLIGIIIHKIPIAVVLSTMFISKKLSKIVFYVALLIFALSAPLGLVLASNFAFTIESTNTIIALAVGIFLHISTTILFESGDGHKFDLKKFAIIVVGFALAIITL